MMGYYKKGPEGTKLGRPKGVVELMPRRRDGEPLAKAKQEWLRQYKLDHGCADCGYNGHFAALDFDHLPGYRKEVPRSGTGWFHWGWNKILEEVEKCEVVCSNCHRIRSYTRGQHRSGYDLETAEAGS